MNVSLRTIWKVDSPSAAALVFQVKLTARYRG
jgi:hypothetical protein